MVLKSFLLFDHLRYSEHLEKDFPNTHKHHACVCEVLSSPFLQRESLYLLTFLSPRGLYPLLYPQVSRLAFWGASRITWRVALPSSSLVHFFPLLWAMWIQSHSPSSLLNLHSPPPDAALHVRPPLAKALLASCDHYSAVPSFPLLVLNTEVRSNKGEFWKQNASNLHWKTFI